MKTQVVVDKSGKRVICTAFANGSIHDFKLFKESGLRAKQKTVIKTDTGFLGITNIHSNSVLPKKGSKYHPLSREDKRNNRKISRERVLNEHIIGFIKRFKIVSDRYRNRRKRFGLRFNLICGICNFERYA
jgi:hypothetical protein